jgi:hypothetical protein
MAKFVAEKKILPAFPRTPHLPWKPNAADDDIVASEADIAAITQHTVHGEEKIDGASVGMTTHDGHPLIRNRDHILRKGYVKDTPAKKQFASIWGWWYDNQAKFKSLAEMGPFSIYGEWMVARHGIYYDRLPDWFIAYDVYNHETGWYLKPEKARRVLTEAGFVVPQILVGGGIGDISEFEFATKQSSEWYNGPVEGVYIKVTRHIDGMERITHRFKMVRSDFERGKFWDGKTLLKNSLVTPETYIVPPKDKRITPKCCQNVQRFQAVFLVVPDSFYEGDSDTPPIWMIACKNGDDPRLANYDSYADAGFCPFCGDSLPEIVKVSTGEYKICTCEDSGYYCATCSERLGECQCLPPTHQWGPA